MDIRLGVTVTCPVVFFAIAAPVSAARVYEPNPVPAVQDSVVDTDMVFVAEETDDFAIDGEVDGKEVWCRAKPIGALVDRFKKGPLERGPEIRLLYSSTALYVGAVVHQQMDTMMARCDQRDLPVWNDDNLEIFLFVPSRPTPKLIQFAINPLGSFADLRDGNIAYTAKGIEIKTKRFSDRWTAEVKLPYDGLPIDRPFSGDFLGIRFCHLVNMPHIIAALPRLRMFGNDRRADFAKLEFAPPKGDGATEKLADAKRLRIETLERRFAARYADIRRRFAEISSGVGMLVGSHLLYERVRRGVAQMGRALEQFETGGRKEEDRETMLAEWAGFSTFAAENAYAVWVADPWESGTPDALPPADAVTAPELSFEQAGNEREVRCLCFHGLLVGSRLDLRVVPVSIHSRNVFVSCDRFEVAEEPFVRLEGETITAPLARKPGNGITLTPGKTVRTWITFNSREVPPGDYATKIALKPAHDAFFSRRDLPVSVKVWRFCLPETKDWPMQSFFWGPAEFRADEVELLKLMHAYHITHGWTCWHQYHWGQTGDYGIVQRKKDAKTGYDFDPRLAKTANEAFFRTARELGMKFVIGWWTPQSSEWFRIMDERLTGMGFNRRDFIFKGLLRDEFRATDISTLAAERAAVWKMNTNLWFQATLLSTPPPAGATLDEIVAAGLDGFYRQWVVYRKRLDDPREGPETVRRLRKKGSEVWSYECDRNMAFKDDLKYYRLYAWDCFMRGFDGMAYWTIYSQAGYPPLQEDCFSSENGLNEGVTWRGIDRRMIPTKQLENVREGLEDVAYMDRLAKELARVEKAGKSHPEFRALLDERRDVMKSNDRRRVDMWRLTAGRAIDVLAGGGK